MRTFKWLYTSWLAVCLMVAEPFASYAQNNTAQFAEKLLALEAHTQWGAVADSWTKLRPGWLAALEKTPMDIGKSMILFESNLKVFSLEDSWQGRRLAWQKQCTGAANQPHLLATLLIELESKLLWSSVDEAWKGLRVPWIADCQKIAASSPANMQTPTFCKELFSLIDELKTVGWKKWAGTGFRSKLWGFVSDTVKSTAPFTGHVLRFTIAEQKGVSGKTLQNAYDKIKGLINQCTVNDWKKRSMTVYNDMVNGNNELWVKEDIELHLYFLLDADASAEHSLILTFGRKR